MEHARVYAFGVDSDMIYLSSADMMTRNTEHRVEIAFPVLDPHLPRPGARVHGHAAARQREGTQPDE